MDALEALGNLYKVITKLSPQAPKSHRGDVHKVELLQNAVVGDEWATEPLSRIATGNLTFLQPYGELEAELTKLREIVTKTSYQDVIVQGTLYAGQGKYFWKKFLMKNRGFGEGFNAHCSGNGRGTFDPLEISGFFDFEDPGNRLSECLSPSMQKRSPSAKD